MKTDNEIIDERYALVMERIRESMGEGTFGEPLLSFFSTCSKFLDELSRILDRTLSGGMSSVSLEELKAENHRLYDDILPENYKKSFA
ncbi:MAG: leucyl aminopeptidase, partial [Lachnospiraceae bacterium]|nr:leucyl aminopeptidase [Lachnospiraceae bacterium]